MLSSTMNVIRRPNHIQTGKCFTRAKYRQGRNDTAVKVFTVSQESYFLLVQNVPSLGVRTELEALCRKFGSVETCSLLPEYPSPEFTETFLVKYSRLQNARTAKKELDERSFFGACLNVCYAPELETVSMTIRKLQERRKMVSARLSHLQNLGHTKNFKPGKIIPKGKDVHYTTKFTQESTENGTLEKPSASSNEPQTVTYIWAGEEFTVPVLPQGHPSQSSGNQLTRGKKAQNFRPRQLIVQKEKQVDIIPTPASLSYEESRKKIRSKLEAMRSSNPEVSLRKKFKLNQ